MDRHDSYKKYKLRFTWKNPWISTFYSIIAHNAEIKLCLDASLFVRIQPTTKLLKAQGIYGRYLMLNIHCYSFSAPQIITDDIVAYHVTSYHIHSYLEDDKNI